MNTLENKQRSEVWHNERLGRFTASEIHKLLGIKGLGTTGEQYCFEKAVEIVFGKDEEDQIETFDMRRGVALEPLAYEKFKELKALDFVTVTPAYFYPYGDNAGASPDANVDNDSVAEFKCPRSTKFFNLVAKGYDAIDPQYIDQMQMQMLSSNSVRCHFFNYLIFKGKEMWHEIPVNRDEKRIDFIKSRIDEGVLKRDEFVKQLINNKQF